MTKVLVQESGYPVGELQVGEILNALAPPLEGKTVLVKPNCLMAASPEEGVTTHPSLVRSLVAALKARGATVQVGDNPGARGYGAGEHCFDVTGLREAAGDSFVDFGRSTVRIPVDSRFAEYAVVSRPVLDADIVISVPKLKTHCLTLMTGAVKNMYGILAGGEKTKFHRTAVSVSDFAEALVDIYSIRPPDMAIMDAVVSMEGDGPTHGSLRRTGRLMASNNAVSLDAAAARLMGVAPGRVNHLAVAGNRGFGSIDLEDIDIEGPLEAVPDFSLPSTFRRGILTFLSNRVVFNLLHRSRLSIDEKECTGCGECRDACPSEAVVERDGTCTIDQGRCHQCFCCSELCPQGAVKVHGALGALLRREGRGGGGK